MNRLPVLLAAVLAGALACGAPGFAQEHARHGGGPSMGGRGFAPPGGRYAGPYGYALPAPRGGYATPYGVRPPYAGEPYPGAPIMRRPNSLGAGWREQQEEARFGVRRGQFAPLGQVIEGIQRHTPGRQLDAGIEYDGGRAIYRVRWITLRGRRVDFLVDAATGAILGER